MKIAVILYILAACFLTASITHCWTRLTLDQRIEEKTNRLIDELNSKKDTSGINYILRLSKTFRVSTDMPCELAFALFAPFATCLFGATFIHRKIALKKTFSWKSVAAGMFAVFVVSIFASTIAVPC